MASFRNHKVSSEIASSYGQAGEVELRERPFEKTGNTEGMSVKTDAPQDVSADNTKNSAYNNELMRKRRKRLLFILLIAAVTTVLLVVVATVPFSIANAGQTKSRDQKYIQELKKQIAELKEALNITNHELKELKKKVEDVVKSANTNNETQMSQLKETVNSTMQELNELKKEVRESANDMTREQLMWRNFTLSELQLQKNEIANLTIQVKNSNKTIGSRGPPGYNGTQGSAGSPGSQGLPGPPGIGSNITLCTYKKGTSPGKTAGSYAREEISVIETKGKKFLGVTCDTNDAKVCLLSSIAGSGGRRTYKCECSNTMSTGDATMYCYVHYWECQTNT